MIFFDIKQFYLIEINGSQNFRAIKIFGIEIDCRLNIIDCRLNINDFNGL